MGLASRFGHRSPVLRSNYPLSNEEIRRVAPSIFSMDAHQSRSERYTYIPTVDVLDALRKEGFEPFMVCQTRCRNEGKVDFTKHMIRLRHRSQIVAAEANEIIVMNSHDGTSGYQMMAGMYRFVCHNGMVCGDTVGEIRYRHKGDVVGEIIDGAYTVLSGFGIANEQRKMMKGITLNHKEQNAFAHAALALKYDEPHLSPIRGAQLLDARRVEDQSNDMWTTFNRVQENMIRGGLSGQTAKGKRTTTRPITSIASDIKMNRALWILAEEMGKLKAA